MELGHLNELQPFSDTPLSSQIETFTLDSYLPCESAEVIKIFSANLILSNRTHDKDNFLQLELMVMRSSCTQTRTRSPV